MSHKISKTLIVIILFVSIFSNYYLYKHYSESKNRITDLENSLFKFNSEKEEYTKETERLRSEIYKLKSANIVYVPEYIHGESYNEGYEEGFEEGKEEGFEEGKEEGYEEGKEEAKDDFYDNNEYDDGFHGY